jgi:hypothetical protein
MITRANRRIGRLTVGGHLVLERDHLAFQPHAANLPRTSRLAMSLADIEAVDVVERNFAEMLAGGLRKRLRIRLSDGREEMFVVDRPEQVASDVRHASARRS